MMRTSRSTLVLSLVLVAALLAVAGAPGAAGSEAPTPPAEAPAPPTHAAPVVGLPVAPDGLASPLVGLPQATSAPDSPLVGLARAGVDRAVIEATLVAQGRFRLRVVEPITGRPFVLDMSGTALSGPVGVYRFGPGGLGERLPVRWRYHSWSRTVDIWAIERTAFDNAILSFAAPPVGFDCGGVPGCDGYAHGFYNPAKAVAPLDLLDVVPFPAVPLGVPGPGDPGEPGDPPDPGDPGALLDEVKELVGSLVESLPVPGARRYLVAATDGHVVLAEHLGPRRFNLRVLDAETGAAVPLNLPTGAEFFDGPVVVTLYAPDGDAVAGERVRARWRYLPATRILTVRLTTPPRFGAVSFEVPPVGLAPDCSPFVGPAGCGTSVFGFHNPLKTTYPYDALDAVPYPTQIG